MHRSEDRPLLAHGRYAPGEVLGAGAQGVVIRVTDREAAERALVAKVFRPGAFRHEVLLGEFALLARLRAPGVVRAHDLGWDERTGAPFLVEEHVGGASAEEWVRAAEPSQRTVRLARLAAQVARALAGLHAAGFVHGDLKPAHVRMRAGAREVGAQARAAGTDASAGEEAVLLDLGAAVSRARAQAGAIAFTSAFAAPEILGGGAPSAASDLYGMGALAWAIAAGRPPSPRASRRPLRAHAPWVEPRVAAVIEALVEVHPRDRPGEAREVLALLGVAAAEAGIALGAPPAPIGREREIAELAGLGGGALRYVVGESGTGKSHLAREVATRERLSGRHVREVSFPAEGDALVRPLVAFLRGHGAWPFAVREDARAPLLLVLDGVDAAPAELVAALDAYRCRSPRRGALSILATARAAPEGAEAADALRLDALPDAAFEALCAALGVAGAESVARLRDESGKVPGWAVASAGRVPLTRDTAARRAEGLSRGARDVLSALAIAGGALPESVLLGVFGASRGDLAELLATSLSTRRAEGEGERAAEAVGDGVHALSSPALAADLASALTARETEPAHGDVVHALSSPALAADLASALATPEIVARLGRALLAERGAKVAALRAVARSPLAGALRPALLARVAELARARDLRSDEIEALVALGADPAMRAAPLLLRLERLQRDAGMGAGYPEVLAWLEEAGRADDRIRVLALRRRAEKTARDGDARRAAELADEAIALADRLGDGPLRAFARATSGLVALMRASYVEAERTLAEAQALLGDAAADDPEEVARMDHNTGVVAIYRGRIDEAVRTFQRALATKRRLGDRAGMRSCLMNLGIALGKADRHDEARAALGEAMGLARSLGQTAGLGWCLSALADIEIRRRDARAAERWLASAAALSSSLPAAIQADLVLASAHVALLDGDGARAGELLAAVDRSVRASDPLVDARTFAALAEARLATLPPDPREAARCAVRAARRARAARLDEVEAQALSILRAARGRSILAPVKPEAAPSPAEDDALWTWLAALAAGGAQATGGGAQGTGGAEDPLVDLARAIVKIAGAERVLVAHVSAAGRLLAAWGADVEGFAIAEAEKRLAPEAIDRALRQAGPLYERDLATAAGRGSRLSARRETPGGAALVVAEHRFRPSAFDAVTAAQAERWATLAALALRTRAPAAGDAPAVAPSPQNARAAAEAPPPPEPPGPDWKAAASPATTTAVPLLEPRRAFPAILGESLALRRALARLDAAIDSDLPVLVTGETGTGKELFARALHEHGPRRDRELVALNCGSVPDALFEAELFGHARGSFTGADRARPGLLARAEGGTLFLDELGELPLGKQAVLLRALESRRYRPVGSDEERPFDVRVVAATNRDLERAAMEGAFRQDLLYRVNAIALTAPPLRARGGDVPLLLRAFAARVSPALEWSDRAEAALAAYAWPGNVRELLHTVERLAALRVPRVELAHLPRAIRAALASPRSAVASPRPASAAPAAPGPARRHASTEEQRTAADEEQREEIRSALRATGGNISRAAERLGLTRHGLKKRMVRLAMRPEVPKNPPDPPQRTS